MLGMLWNFGTPEEMRTVLRVLRGTLGRMLHGLAMLRKVGAMSQTFGERQGDLQVLQRNRTFGRAFNLSVGRLKTRRIPTRAETLEGTLRGSVGMRDLSEMLTGSGTPIEMLGGALAESVRREGILNEARRGEVGPSKGLSTRIRDAWRRDGHSKNRGRGRRR